MKHLCVFLFCFGTLTAQIDSALTVPLLGINFGASVPGGDLATRFGPNLYAGGNLILKTKKNWLIGIDCNYMFGRNVKEDVLKQITNSDGFVVDNEGFPGDLRVTERGLALQAVFGKIFPVGNVNPNSGLMLKFGAGYMEHKINLYDAQQRIALVKGPLREGYDRLTNGPMLSQSIGYLFLSENRLLNFYFGFEASEGFTKSVRKLNYDTGLRDDKQRLDILYGARIGWILPLYKKRPNDFYYN
jgi:hypothetical protein